MRAMHNQYRELFEDADEDQNHLLDFPEFLLLMRDLVDIDFGGVSTKSRRELALAVAIQLVDTSALHLQR